MKARLDATTLHVLFVALVSLVFEAHFVPYSINLMDEGWPLYAAMRLHEGGTLYRDVFWVFPPGHLLPAWIGYGLDPPGIIVARILYAAFTVALVVASYFLGRRLMPARHAVFAALLLALCATSAHRLQLVFGYRYLVFSVLALLAFARRLDTGDRRYSFAAGLLTGVAFVFRFDPAVAVAMGIGAAILATDAPWRVRLRDAAACGAGFLLVVAPVAAWFASTVGLPTVFFEAFVRPIVMTDLQSLPLPKLAWLPATSERGRVMRWFLAWQFRLYLLLYAAYGIAICAVWLRAWRAGRPAPRPLLVGLVVFGAIYFVRSLGRSDAAHLYSAIPPVCLLLGHALSQTFSRLRATSSVERVVMVVLLAAWIYGMGSEVFFFDAEARGLHGLASTGNSVFVNNAEFARQVDDTVAAVRARTGPDDEILVLGPSPLLYVLCQRSGPGYADLVLPGTFIDREEEGAFVRVLAERPPKLVVWPGESLDDDPLRHAKRSAPMLAAWIRRNYKPTGVEGDFKLLVHTETLVEAAREASRKRQGPQSRDSSGPSSSEPSK